MDIEKRLKSTTYSDKSSKKLHVEASLIKPSDISRELTTDTEPVVDANTVITFHQVTVRKKQDGTNQLVQLCSNFNPGMTHQVFDNEQITGIKNPEIDVYFNPSTCDMCVTTKCDSSTEDKKKLSKRVRKWTSDGTNINRIIYANRIAEVESQFKPSGTLLDQYTTQHGEFCIFLNTLTSPDSLLFFKNVQSLSYWFIDGASEIVLTPDSPHRWLMLTVYSTIDGIPVFVGYCFLYIFSNPFQSPSHSLRLCQILILPPFQKQGHSSRIFHVIYNKVMHTKVSSLLPQFYCEATDDCSSVDLSRECAFYMYTVEDPCDDFTFVRDVFDCRLLRKLEVMKPYLTRDQRIDVLPLSDETIEAVRKQIGIISNQLQKCYNILLHHIYCAQSASYCSYIKRQIAAKHRNELELIRERDVFKENMDSYFQCEEDYYEENCVDCYLSLLCLCDSEVEYILHED